jgi:hypothetical protein
VSRTLVALSVAIALLVTVAACSSQVSGTGEPGAGVTTPRTTSRSTSVSPTFSTPAPTVASTRLTASAPTIVVSTPPTTTRPPTTATTATTPPVQGPASILTVTYAVTCASKTDANGTVKLTWTTKGANNVYVLEGQLASTLIGADAKTQGGKGPYSPNTTVTQPFHCSYAYDYFLIEAYNTTDNTHSGQVTQVPYAGP